MADLKKDDLFRARIEPRTDGRWSISLVKLVHRDSTSMRYGSGNLESIYGVQTVAFRRTEKRARRKASRMLAKLRKAVANAEREPIEVSE